MQSVNELVQLISEGRPDVPLDTVKQWAHYLRQLSGCHLFSVASPEKDEKEWLQRRKTGIGGSDISAVLGENDYTTPRQLWMTKLGMFDDDAKPQSEAAHWGNMLETTVATEWGNRNKRQWVHIPVILQDDKRSYLLANVDGFTLTDDREMITGILEIKTTSAYNNDLWEVGPLPNNYIHQVNWYCGITGLKRFVIVCLVGGQKLYAHDLPADPDRFARQVKAADEFWNEYVLPGVEPPATGGDVAELMTHEQKLEEPGAVFVDDEMENLAESYCVLRKKIKGLQEIQAAVKAQILVRLGAAPNGITRTHNLTYTYKNNRSCDYKRLEVEFPEAYDACVSTSQSKTFNID